ncbi:hypothetical protein GKE82_01700 [Conexibacter sp. W3-3-2]|uniref:lipopolysaccharide biosynthesis protein n=1 Tax=Conexibacter sp. W3-3-2 TaxID=2675227 RepID=UPI0012B8A657|nr:MATE family efflux transporter [Conexibacter sp. W3-3-2]MTD43051.1 hypothetical protein [Conexibacter sp. W3-3-2]
MSALRGPVTEAVARARAALADPLLRNALYIMGTTIVTALAGFVFWIVAARTMATDEVGVGAALVSTMLLVGLLTNLGFGHVFIARLASRAPGAEWSLTVCVGLATTAAASLAAGLLAALLLPLIVEDVRRGTGLELFVLLPLGVTGAAWSFLFDYACIAERTAAPAFWRNGGMAVLRVAALAAVPLVGAAGNGWVLGAWVGAFAVFSVLGLARTLPRLERDFSPTLRGWRPELAAMRGLLAGHHVINVGGQVAPFVLPVVVSAQLGAEENAHFYATWMVATVIFLIAPSLSNALFAEGAHHPERVEDDLRRAVRQFTVLAIPTAVLLVAAGPLVLRVFGDAYSEDSRALLALLVLTAAADAGQSMSVAVLRVRERLRDAASVTLTSVVVGVGATWVLLPSLGVGGAAIGLGIGRLLGLVLGVRAIRRGALAPALVPARPAVET